LTERERTRLRQLAGMGRRSAQEAYELGSLKGRARHDPAGRRLLDDITHSQASRRQPPASTRRGAGSLSAQQVAAAVAQRLQEWDEGD
jgi:hypothetical protein